MRKIWLIVVAGLLLVASIMSTAAQDTETLDTDFDGPLRVGYIPIMVMEQHFVANDQGWYEELGVEVDETRFSSGAPIVQAFAAGELDAAYVGINPALVMASRGVPIKVVAANVTDALTVLANDEFAAIWDENPTADAFSIYEEQTGRKLRVATLPDGTTPNTVLKLWLNQLGLTADAVNIVPQGVEQVQASLATNRVDASLIMEPVISLSQAQDWGFEPIVYANEILEQQPAGVFVVTQDLIDNYPELVQQLVEIHVRGTNFANDDLDRAGRIASDQIGSDILPVEVAQQAANSRAINWISDPAAIIDSTQVYNQFQVDIGVFEESVAQDDLFDTSFYDTIIEENPEWAVPAPDAETTPEPDATESAGD